MPRIRLVSIGTVMVLSLAIASCGGGKALVHTGEGFIDDILRGGRAAEYQLGDDAGRAAVAALDDGPELQTISEAIERNADWVCFVLDAISEASDALTDSTETVILPQTDAVAVGDAAADQGIDAGLTNELIATAQTMAQSTLVGAANTACELADSGL